MRKWSVLPQVEAFSGAVSRASETVPWDETVLTLGGESFSMRDLGVVVSGMGDLQRAIESDRAQYERDFNRHQEREFAVRDKLFKLRKAVREAQARKEESLSLTDIMEVVGMDPDPERGRFVPSQNSQKVVG